MITNYVKLYIKVTTTHPGSYVYIRVLDDIIVTNESY